MRRPGTGSIEPIKRADGTTAYYPRLPGSHKRRRLDAQASPEQAEAVLAEAIHQIAEGGLVHAEGTTLAAWGRRCILRRQEDGYRNAARELDRWAAHVETCPLGALGIAQVTCADILEWARGRLRAPARKGHGHKTLRRRTVSRSVVVDALRLVRLAFSEAALAGIRADNPALVVRLPKGRGHTHDPWTWLRPEEVRRLLDARGLTDEDRDAALWALYTGVRQGEQWTQHVRDVDLERGRVTVRYGGRKGHDLLPTKGKRPRTLALLPPAVEIARRQIARLAAPGRRNPRGLLWPSTARQHPGAFRGEGHPVPRFAEWIDAAGLTPEQRGEPVAVTWHSLRHTFASLVLAGLLPGAEGVPWPIERVSAYLGHRSIAITQRYADVAALLLPTTVQQESGSAVVPAGVEPATNGLGNRCSNLAEREVTSQVGPSVDTPLGRMSAATLEALAAELLATAQERKRTG